MVDIKEILNYRAARFTFRKKDGSIREAYGTRNPTLVNQNDATPKGTGVERTGVTTYYDLEKNAWRCFRDSDFLELID